MRKQIKKWGSSHVIVLTMEEMRLYNLSINDVIDLTIIKIQKEKKHG